MTDKLTPEQRLRVAEAVIPGGVWEIMYDTKPYRIATFLPNGDCYGEWFPAFDSDTGLLLIRWLSKTLPAHKNDEGWMLPFITAIANDDTDTLERMAYELLEASDDTD